MVNHQADTPPQEAAILSIKLSDEEFGSFEDREAAFALEDRLEEVLSETDEIEYDGHEFGGGWCKLYFYGPEAKRIADALRPALRSRELAAGSTLVLRFGPPGAREKRLRL